MTEMPSSHEFGIWDAASPTDHAHWAAHWLAWPSREVAAHPAYAQMFCTRRGERALAAYWNSRDGCVLYPFVFRDLSGEPFWRQSIGGCADISSPYGYGGPFFWGQDREQVARQFWDLFDRWAEEQCVVSEFVRMSLFSDALLPYPGRRVAKLTNIVCDLAGDEQSLWNNAKSKVRRNIKKAEREGVEVVCDESAESSCEFQRLYAATMDRRAAHSGYYFPESFYDQLHGGLPGQYAYFHARHGGQTISTELVLVSADRVYFFLGGTDSDYFALRPNELLKFKVMLWAQARGKKHYVLGGGVTEKDSLFKFKESFAPTGVTTYYVGQRVYDSTRYEQLAEQRDPGQAAATTDFFPAYRAA